jgi:Protein of unknown function (DUF4244)
MFPQPQPNFLINGFLEDDAGMATPESAILMIAGAVFAITLLVIAKSEWFERQLSDLVEQAITVNP